MTGMETRSLARHSAEFSVSLFVRYITYHDNTSRAELRGTISRGVRNACSASATSVIDIVIAVNAARRNRINVHVYLIIKHDAKREMWRGCKCLLTQVTQKTRLSGHQCGIVKQPSTLPLAGNAEAFSANREINDSAQVAALRCINTRSLISIECTRERPAHARPPNARFIFL